MLNRLKSKLLRDTPTSGLAEQLADLTRDVSSLSDRVDHLAFYVNMVKNGMSVYVGEYAAVTRLFTGQKLYVDTRDVSVAPHLLLDGEWEIHITNVFRSYLRPDTIVFDVGANFGYYTVVAGTQVTVGHLHAFEANPDLIPLVQRSLSVNGLTGRTTLNNVAVASSSGETANITVYRDHWGAATLGDVPPTEAHAMYEVQTISLDDYCTANHIGNVDVIKIDIEGYEDRAYRGMRRIVRESPNLVLFLEFTASEYSEPEEFFDQIVRDFGHVFVISQLDGSLSPVTTIADLPIEFRSTWVMLLATKHPANTRTNR